MAAIQLTRVAATALLKEAQRDFNNGAQELWNGNDESQRPVIEACVEIIGRLTWKVETWPRHETPIGFEDDALVEFEFTAEALDWVDRSRLSQESYVTDLDEGAEATDLGYVSEQVYLLHVLSDISSQRALVAG